ncbi:MAG: hypothetical protein R3A10_10680 [Caldilineaceae bacterium]
MSVKPDKFTWIVLAVVVLLVAAVITVNRTGAGQRDNARLPDGRSARHARGQQHVHRHAGGRRLHRARAVQQPRVG